jgi:hypothetical protein
LTVYCATCNVPCLSDVIDSVTIFVEAISPPQSYVINIPSLIYSDQIFYIDSLPQGTKMRLYDMRGRIIFKSDNYENNYAVGNLNGANYVYEIILPNERSLKGKFCVVKR